MAIGIIIGIVLGVLAIVAFIGAYVAHDSGSTAFSVLACIVGAILVIAIIVVPFSFHTVNSGEVAVVKQLGKVNDEERPAGTHFDLWVTNTYIKIDTTVQTVDLTLQAYSADAQTMDVATTLQFQIITDRASDIIIQYGSLDNLRNRITSVAIEKIKSELSTEKAMDIIANRAQMSPRVEEAIKLAIGEQYHVNVVAVVLTDITFTDAFELAVEEKMIAEQAKLRAEYENQTKIAQAAAEAEAKLKAAEAEIEIAKAQAEALMIAAKAEADANKLISESLTDEVLEIKFYEKWNGELPQVMGEGSAIIDMREAREAE